MSPYPTKPLGTVLSRAKDTVVIDPQETYKQVTVRLFHNGVILRGQKLGSEIRTSRQWLVHQGQVLLSRIDARNGAIGTVPPELEGAIVTNDFWAFNVNVDFAEPAFLDAYFGTPAFVDACNVASEGTTNRVRLQPVRFLDIRVPLPPLDEQRRIISRISNLELKIAEANRLQEAVIEQMDALCRSLITNPPDGVLTPTSMSDLLVMRGPEIRVEPTQPYHFAGVYCFGRGVFAGQRKDGSEFAYRSLTRIQKGNFIYPKLMAWEGALGVVQDNCDGLYVSPEFPVFEVRRDRVLPEVLDIYFRMPAVWPDLAAISTGTNVRRKRLHPRAFLQYKLPLPSMKVQHQLCAVRRSIEQAKLERRESATELTALMPSILSKAFRGEL
jgi:type I restriction enzyme S subunit